MKVGEQIMPYSGTYFPAFGRTQSALGDVSRVISGLGENIALRREREQAHERTMRGLEIQRTGEEAKQELGLLKTQAGIARDIEQREQREYLRDVAGRGELRDIAKEEREIETQGLKTRLLTTQVKEAEYQGQPISMRNEFLINAGIPEADADEFINRQGIYTRAALTGVGRRDVQRKLFNDIATAYRKEQATLIKADSPDKRKKEYEANLGKLREINRDLINIEIKKQNIGMSDPEAFEQSFIQQRDYYLGLNKPYKAEMGLGRELIDENIIGELTNEFNPAEYKGKVKIDSETNQGYISDGERWMLYNR